MGHGQNPENHSKLSIEFNNDGTKIFILGGLGASTHIYNLTTAYDISSMSSDTIVPDDGIDWTTFDGKVPGASPRKFMILILIMMERKCIYWMDNLQLKHYGV